MEILNLIKITYFMGMETYILNGKQEINLDNFTFI